MRYRGKICNRHPELQGERLKSNRRCVRCHRERRQRWKQANIEQYRTSDRDKQRRWRQAHPEEARVGSHLRTTALRVRKALKRYIGPVCDDHPELKGERYAEGRGIGCCVQCHHDYLERWERSHEGEAYKRSHERKQWNAEERSKSSQAIFRARSKGATVDDTHAIDRAFIALSRKAKSQGKVIDHVVPLRPCRVCGAQGGHEPSNWQLLTNVQNASKGNRCQSCI